MDPQAGGTPPSRSPSPSAAVTDDEKAKDQSANVQQQGQAVQQTLQAVTDRALDFLSTASNETIGACLVGLGAGTYMLLGRVGLVLIGAVGGVVLHATWEGTRGPSDNGKAAAEDGRRKEIGLDVIQRLLKWRSPGDNDDATEDGEVRVDTFGLTEKDLDFSDFKPETAEALRSITDAVIRDYVKWWYSPIIPDEPTFPYASRITLTSFILGISNNLSRKRPADAFLNFVTHTSSTVVVFLNELATAINASPHAKAEDAVRAYVELKPNSNLANVLDTTQQRRKLAMVAEDILQTYLEPKTYNCQPAHVFLRQILANTIIDNTIEKCSEAWWINDWIVYLLEEGEPALAQSVNAGLEGDSGDVKGNIVKEAALIETSDKVARKASDADHRRVVSRGQEAFDDAMQEAARLTKLMQEEDERYAREQAEKPKEQKPEQKQNTPVEQDATLAAAGALSGVDAAPTTTGSSTSFDQQSESTTQGMDTPTSSQSEKNGDTDPDSERVMSSESQRSDQQDTTSPVSDAPPAAFTSFDQLAPGMTASLADDESFAPREREPLTLLNANMTIFDDAMPGDKQAIKAKPTVEYLIQIEPASSDHSGWMVAKKYSDIETLHESIRRISVVTGAKFHELHPAVPQWRGRTKSQLREALERYLNDACRAKSLAESEAMRRFLEKEQGLMKSPGNKGGLNAAFGAVGKGIMGAGKGIEGGGKALVGGVTGVFGGLGPKRTQSNSTGLPRTSTSSPHNRSESVLSTATKGRQSTDSLRKTISQAQTDGRATPSLESDRRSSLTNGSSPAKQPSSSSPGQATLSEQPEALDSRPASIIEEQDEKYEPLDTDEVMQLPPPPSQVTDDYDGHAVSSPVSPAKRHKTESIFSTATTLAEPPEAERTGYTALPIEPEPTQPRNAKPSKEYQPLNEQETTIVVELLFATITELYTLSSAWSLRRTLLNAAKTYLLRPGNPQLASIRELIQSTVLDANTSDEGIALQLRKLRENSLPTEEEFAAWPKPLTDDEKETLRKKARKLLVTKGMPVALTSVMGQAASGEAMGKVFDCLQVKEVARGLMFGLMLQGIRTIVQ